MLAIRMQRTGRKGHAMFRMVVQDARRTPTSGKVVARIGSYDPHAKSINLDKEKASFYLEHGAQPSERVAFLLKQEGVKLPDWVVVSSKSEAKVRNPDKRRSTRPEEPASEAPAAEEAQADTTEAEAPAAESTAADQTQPETTEEVASTELETPEAAEESPAEAKAPTEETETESPAEVKPAGETDDTESAQKAAATDK